MTALEKFIKQIVLKQVKGSVYLVPAICDFQITEALEEEKKQGQTLPIHDVSGSKQMIEALDELVQVKEYKEKHGKDEQYETAKEQAWKNAKDLLNTYYR